MRLSAFRNFPLLCDSWQCVWCFFFSPSVSVIRSGLLNVPLHSFLSDSTFLLCLNTIYNWLGFWLGNWGNILTLCGPEIGHKYLSHNLTSVYLFSWLLTWGRKSLPPKMEAVEETVTPSSGGTHQTLLLQGPVELRRGWRKKKQHLFLSSDLLVVSNSSYVLTMSLLWMNEISLAQKYKEFLFALHMYYFPFFE